MFDALISAIDALLDFVGPGTSKRLSSEAEQEELERLDSMLEEACDASGLRLDLSRQTELSALQPFGYCGVRYAQDFEGWALMLTPDWRRALQRLRSKAEALRETRQQRDTAGRTHTPEATDETGDQSGRQREERAGKGGETPDTTPSCMGAEPTAPPRRPAHPGRYAAPAVRGRDVGPNGAALWDTDPVKAFERLRDRVCEAVHVVVETHRWALTALPSQSMANVGQELRDALYQSIAEAQAIWYDTPIARYLDRPEGPVYLDHQESRTIARVSGSCNHDLVLGVAVGLWRWIEEAVPARGYVTSMRFYTAAGDDVGQHLTALVSLVRCECQQGIARWREAARQQSQAGGTWPARWVQLPESMWPKLPPEVAAQVESQEPITLTLGLLSAMLGSGGNLVPATLARCRELPAIRSYATRLGFCRPGEFTDATVTAIVDLLCVEQGTDQRAAYALRLDAVAEFLKARATGNGTGQHQAEGADPPRDQHRTEQGEGGGQSAEERLKPSRENMSDPFLTFLLTIDTLLAFVDCRQPIPREGERRDRFDALDRDVWVAACRLGYEGKLPRPSAGPRKYLGKTNLPCDWNMITGFDPFPRDWKNDLLALRALAEREQVERTDAPRDQDGSGQADGSGEATKTPALETSVGGSHGETVELTKVERAIQIYLRDPNQSVREVARQVPCDPALLYRDERFKRLRETYQGKLPKGSKSTEGDLEAEDEDES